MASSAFTTTAALGAAAAWALPAPAAHVPALAAALRLPCRRPGLPGVALTFDDGPHPEGTPRVLDALAAAGAQATFFLVGEQVRRTGSLAAEIRAAGHAVAVHSDRHRSALRLTPRAVEEDRRRAAATIGDALGEAPLALYRPPYGILSLPALRALGVPALLWSRWGADWTARATPASVAARVLRPGPLTAGEVVLLHDADDYGAPGCWRATAGALPAILAATAAAGLPALALR
ncbi:polysaccharide deacetylase family protein [Paraconexibacter antarcticus]|uniref:Polysaccharide deacetylase family protein n=1 Tax=Paraconexibacter antarcticus TaxID=2949664 RepID=A0ABY5DT50_9ACTN|nr:polysaccharide deacetylase family protein [Paraconexibacter antarcticus]UTI63729.1 polysaccharide deacetylase family protein [Paraconexibacter antarcticus]